jgi:hypothetical protein
MFRPFDRKTTENQRLRGFATGLQKQGEAAPIECEPFQTLGNANVSPPRRVE